MSAGRLDALELDANGRRRLLGVADILTRYRFEFWNYGESIGLEGLLDAAELLDEPRLEGWVHGALRAAAASGRPVRELDNTVAGLALCAVAERRDDAALIRYGVQLATFLAARRRVGGVLCAFEHAPMGGPPHGGGILPPDEAAILADPPPGTCVDCIHFDPPFFTHLGALVGDAQLLELGAREALAAAELLQDDGGLFWHFWLEPTRRRYGIGWGRGQGWALLGFADVLDRLPSDHPAYEPARAVFVRLAAALAELQREDGSWYAAVHDPASGEEASTPAFAAAGFARGVRAGLLDESYADRALRAWRAAWSWVNDDGLVQGVSAAVYPSTQPSHYRHVPRGLMSPWGQGPILHAAASVAAMRA